MSPLSIVGALAGSRVVRRRSGGETRETTVRWRDKRAQGALLLCGCFCSGICSQTHIAPQICNVRKALKSLVLFAFSHLAGAHHAR